MTIQQLRMLREVAAKGTIAAAALSLGYTPSAVSQQLSGLERATGVAVLERIGRNVRLTSAGQELVRHAGDLLGSLEAARAAMEQAASGVRGTLELSVYESVALTLLVPLLERLAAEHPDLTVRTSQMEPEDGVAAVAAGELDLAFTLDYPHTPIAPHRGVTTETVLEDVFHLVVPEDDPLVVTTARLADVADRTFIAPNPTMTCGNCVVVACRSEGFEPDIAHRIDDFPNALRLVAAGAGVALVPDLGLVHPTPGVRVIDLDPPLSRTVQLAHRTASADRPSIVAVRAALADVVADLLAPA